MKKIIILAALGLLLLTGCTEQGAGIGNKSEDTTMNTAKETLIETTATNEIDKKLNEALTKIDEAASTAIANIERATPKSQATTTAPITKPPTTTTTLQTTTTKTPESQTIPLEITSACGNGSLNIYSVHLDYEKKIAKFYYKPDKDNEKLLAVGIEKLNGKYDQLGIGGSGGIWAMEFQNITDFSDLSTVTLTYAFEGFDPVTVTFDIPGIK